RRGHCGVRENRGGEYFTLVYGRVIMPQNDPIEKKPFNHFLPGTTVLSTATAGCNLHCKFCQNWQLSQSRPEEVSAGYLPPEELVTLARQYGSPSVALTYSEPTVFYEYMHDTAKAARAAGLRCVVVSNGDINPEPAKKLIPHLAAYRIDLKAFSDDYYRDICSGRLAPVLATLKTVVEMGLWLEVINLILPTLNDTKENVRALAGWVRDNLGDMVPIHFTRFHPMYRMLNLPPTPVRTLEACYETAREAGIKYPYLGNVPGHPYTHTYCHQCQELLIERVGLWSMESRMRDGRCPKCGAVIPGVWS
ncbi:MAG: AmmeMemoRadiSam system radical SAM enzyme, partial [Thermodesulfobacteriota bacterium]